MAELARNGRPIGHQVLDTTEVDERTMPGSIDVLLVDDHPLMVAGMSALLAARGIDAAGPDVLTEDAILASARRLRPRVVVLDFALPTLGDSRGMIQPLVRAGHRVAMLTGTLDDALWGELLSLGAGVVLGKDEPLADVVEVIVRLLADEPVRAGRSQELLMRWREQRDAARRRQEPFAGLTSREADVLWSLYEGFGPPQIAEQQFVAVETVRSQLKSAFRKIGVSSQLEAVALVRESGWRPGKVEA